MTVGLEKSIWFLNKKWNIKIFRVLPSLSNLDAPESMDDKEPVVSARFTGFHHFKNNPKI